MSKPCQLRVLSSGKYCCEVDQFEVYENCVGQIKFANLPATVLEYEITPDTWIPAEPPIIEGSDCVTIYKSGTYRFGIDCEALNDTEAPKEGAMALCYECCRIEDYGQELLACFQELKGLIVAGNDTTATVEIINQLELLCAKLLEMLTALEVLPALCDKLEAVIAQLETLCTKIEEGFEAMLECFETMKGLLTSIESELIAVNENLVTVIGNQTGMSCDKPTHVTICGIDPEECCVVAPGSLEVPARCQSYRPDSTVGDGSEFTTYSVGVGGVYVDLPNPNTDADVIAALNGLCGDWSIVVDPDTGRRTICNTDVNCPAAVWKQCTRGNGDNGFPIFQCGLSASASLLVEPTLECSVRMPTVGCYDKKIADLLETLVAINNDALNKLCDILGSPEDECCKPCPELIVGDAEFTTESDNGLPGDPVTFPVTSPLSQTSDFSVPIALPEAECFTDQDALIVIRWCFDHEIDPTNAGHTGFNVSGSDGTQTIGTVVGQSGPDANVNVGPGNPHNGPRDKYWVDIEFTVAQLQAGAAVQTSAFGAAVPETETIYSQDLSIQTDLAELGCC